ncbi:MAG: response regulator [Candidatus Krumholzibacteriia bacterium]
MKDFKVLLVDDEEDFVRSLAERIEMRDVRPDVALDGEEALEKIRREAPDVMVLDLKMPGMHGLEVLEKVKKAFPDLQVVILTGHGTTRDEDDARRLGAYAYLKKPVALDKLMQTVTEAYRHKVELTMAASALAEGGDFDSAREMLDRQEAEKRKRKDKGKDKDKDKDKKKKP